jgi:glycosyltransferase involved in cell wall biosynthesis
MLSVIIASQDSERTLVPTLSALVAGATAGLVRDVIVADGGSRDATAEVADIAGCEFMVSTPPLGARLAQAAERARAPWLLFLTAGVAPQSGWVEETTRFIEAASRAGGAEASAAVFRAVSPMHAADPPWREALGLLAQSFGLARPASHGLLIGKVLYRGLAARGVAGSALESDVIPQIVRRLGRRRIVILRCGAVAA